MRRIPLPQAGRLLGWTLCLALLAASVAPAQAPPIPATPMDLLSSAGALGQGVPGKETPANQAGSAAKSTPMPAFIDMPADMKFSTDQSTCKSDPPASDTELFDNLSLFLGLDGSKGPEDLGVNANFGSRTAANWGFPVFEPLGLGMQLGTSWNYSPSAVRVLETEYGIKEREQVFTTLGLFQRTDCGLRWEAAYDFLYEHYYGTLNLGQWRGLAGYEFRPTDELGVWATLREHGCQAEVGTTRFGLEPITQANLYFRHTWNEKVDTCVWVGMCDQHSRFNIVFPGTPDIHDAFVFGASLYVPLNNWLAIYGEANFITPNDSGSVTATLGIAFYPGGKTSGAGQRRFAPLLPVANNETFAVDVDR